MNPILRFLLTRTFLVILAFIIILSGSYFIFSKNLSKLINNLEERNNLLIMREKIFTETAESIKLKEEISKIEALYNIKIEDLKNKFLNRPKLKKDEALSLIKNYLSQNNIKIVGEEAKLNLVDSFSIKIEGQIEDIDRIEKIIQENNWNLKIININIQPLQGSNLINIEFEVFQ